MNTLKYDRNGDWVLNELVHGDAQLIQNLEHLLRTRATEWMFNEQHGFRRGVIEQKLPNRRQIVQAMHDCLYQEPRVAEVLKVDYEFDRVRRNLAISFKVRTNNGHEVGDAVDVNLKWI